GTHRASIEHICGAVTHSCTLRGRLGLRSGDRARVRGESAKCFAIREKSGGRDRDRTGCPRSRQLQSERPEHSEELTFRRRSPTRNRARKLPCDDAVVTRSLWKSRN